MAMTVTKPVLKRETATPGTYEQVMGAVISGGPSGSRNVNTWEPMSGVAIKKAGKRQYGNLSVECPWDPADTSQANILAAIIDDTPALDSWELGTSLATNPGLQFDGVVTSWGLMIPNTGFMSMRFEIGMASGVTAGASTSVTPSATFDPQVSDGTTATYGAAALPAWDNFELTGYTRALVTSTPVPDDAPTGGPSNTRQRGNFTMDLVYDDANTTHQAIKTACETANSTAAMVFTFPDASTLTVTVCPSTWDESGLSTKDSHNRVKVSGYCTTDPVVA